ncbi:LysR family transcriptional regulator [Staphylococcus devriesei]|uniref:LysR family transcriptional regulator n=3 Tax=Staphylococcus devriesei TaxID=586733 RepID=A0A2K4DFE0_9STAP|nr:LysR family transcriptional regulator [Staphylococcus devriesei]MCE5091315.1 LysR family transcriptional regulator [Staphylococcus devriesei]MCE5096607.1 LysR family transcriptional regulator [Staphylococcus devriesei]PNZ85567.1 LysR family transcriptional regulator [Staphylococcus devriesei]PTF01571.1 LysR family transcriptional regulator [Staphylococcus devriesei]PTF11786.1 LysR family transcriptional regulator [Staphylococcus devriesei]
MLFIDTLIKEGSFSKASNKLYVSQPYYSNYIKSIETSLGVTLFNRKKKPLILTTEGEIYYEYLKDIDLMYLKMTQKLTNISNYDSGFLRIGTNPTLASHVLHKVLPAFTQKYPKIKIDLIEGDTKDLENKLLDNKIDICFNTLPLWNSSIDYAELYAENIYLVISSQNILYKDLDNLTLDQIMSSINHQKFIMLKDRYGLRKLFCNILKYYEISPNVTIETVSIDTAHKLALYSGSFTFIPETSVTDKSNVKYLKMPEQFKNRVVLAFKNKDLLSKASTNFIDFSKTHIFN